MGEYATRTSDNERIKIGTCEDMYYLRFDQRRQVKAESGNVDPVTDAAELRFRFPWPDEDTHLPGEFEDYHRSLPVRGVTAGEGVDHDTVQFSAPNGYIVSLPCPESAATAFPVMREGVPRPDGPVIHLNGYGGAARLVAQKFRPGIGLVPIMKCGGCGAMWRMEGRDDIEALAVALRSQGDKDDARHWHQVVADRVLAGILEAVEP